MKSLLSLTSILFLSFCVGQAMRRYEQLSDRVNVALPEGTLSICPLTDNAVREYLQDYPVIEIIGDCKNGRQAVQAINENKRDEDGLDCTRVPWVLEICGLNNRAAIVFRHTQGG
jgi:hypothetical protein